MPFSNFLGSDMVVSVVCWQVPIYRMRYISRQKQKQKFGTWTKSLQFWACRLCQTCWKSCLGNYWENLVVYKVGICTCGLQVCDVSIFTYVVGVNVQRHCSSLDASRAVSFFLFPVERLPLLCNLKFPKLCGALRWLKCPMMQFKPI